MRCASQFRRISGRGSTTRICPVCQKQFSRPNAHFRGSTSCCSYECSRKIRPRRKGVILKYTCRACGKSFQRRKGYSGPANYCSLKCSIKSTRKYGKEHPKWKGGITERQHSSRRAIKIRLERVSACERCGATKSLHGHHKKPYADFPELRDDPNNIEILCLHCHALEHPSVAGLMLSRVEISQK